MRKIFLFMNVSLDGYVEAPGHDISIFHGDFEAFSAGDSGGVDTLLFGHRTYDMMKLFWPTAQATQTAPEVAQFMNDRRKIVVSHQPFDPGWKNVTVFSGDALEQISQLKAQPGQDIIILGSNTLCVSLMQEDLIDEFQIVVNPVALGAGTSLFAGLSQKAELTLIETRPFKNGAILLKYQPAAT
jgi:dihydrofolate reductase